MQARNSSILQVARKAFSLQNQCRVHKFIRRKMEGKSRLPEMSIPPAPRPVVDGGAVDAASKAAGKEPISPGTPSSAAAGRSSKQSRAEGSAPLPGWKLDALCQENGPSPAMRARFLYF